MLCPLSYAPSRPRIRGERLTLLTRVVLGRLRGGLPLEGVGLGVDRRVRPAVGPRALRRAAVVVDRPVETKRRELRQRIETCESGKSDLIDRLADAETTDDEFWTAAVGADDSLDLRFGRIDAAEESIVVVATDVSAQFDVDREGPELLDRLLGAIRSGVDVSVPLSPDVFDDARAAVDADRATLTIAQGPFELRIAEDAYGNFYLIDGEEVCLEVADPLAPDRLFGMLDLRDRGFAARVRDGFEAAWADGTVVDDV
ncbi:DUF7436 family protein [Halorubrum tebenquichense]|uniref:Transcriptional regulator, TrmB n=1 Tax=Halorubrum tebenquichense DSM 14210 TaxID=1227485 RepID=M0DWU8_9EURY|nr:hypothetical protein [Halorubrum tebenquichense]ELZ38554.1 transcriptional regulator, TrmB [Halorubrum tebenquichense DSM 14210]